MKIKITYRQAGILDWILTAAYLALAFWVDWRIGLAFLAYDLSCVFVDMRSELKKREQLEGILNKLRENKENQGDKEA